MRWYRKEPSASEKRGRYVRKKLTHEVEAGIVGRTVAADVPLRLRGLSAVRSLGCGRLYVARRLFVTIS